MIVVGPNMNAHPPQPYPQTWQSELSQALKTGADLLKFGLISAADLPQTERLLAKYQFLLPRYYAELIDLSNPHCPIRLQAVPALEEEIPFGFSDPLGDFAHRPVDRITHRYKNRALLHLTPNCSMYCRFCFRKTLLNEESDEFFCGNLLTAFEYLRSHPEIEEVILSGGDPLMVSDANLTWTLRQLEANPTLKRVRLHTRVPVTFPQRVTAELVSALAIKKPVIVVTHFNHAKEITVQSTAAIAQLKDVGIRLLNQSVLLHRVNDSVAALKELCERLFEIGVQPYYLHHPDAAAGTSHFQISRVAGKAIYHGLRTSLSGYLVPRYVVDQGDAEYKNDA